MALVISVGTVVVYVFPMVLTPGIVFVVAAANVVVESESDSCITLKIAYRFAFVYPWRPEVYLLD